MNSEATALMDESTAALELTKPAARPLFDRLLAPVTILLVVVYAIPILTFPPGRDQGTYLQIGQSLLEGKHLYVQLWDNKPPGIFWVYAVIAKVFGRVMWSVAIVDFVLLLAISYLLFRFAKRYLGRAAAALAVIVHASWHSGMMYFWIAQPETLQVLCALAALLLLVPEAKWWTVRCFAAGLLCGFGFWLKYNFIGFMPLLLLLPFLESIALDENSPRFALTVSWREWLLRIALIASGFALTVVVVLGWIVFTGGWPAMQQAQFQVLPRYARMAITRNPHYLLMAVHNTYLYLRPATWFVTLAAVLIGWWRRDFKRLVPVLLAAAAALATTVAQVRFHSYYFQVCFPFFAIIWAYLVLKLVEITRWLTRVLKIQRRGLIATLLWILAMNIAFLPIPEQVTGLILDYVAFQQWCTQRETFYADYPNQISIELLRGQMDVINYVKRNTKPSDSIFLWGSNSLIYFLTDRRPPTRFVLNLGVMAKWGEPSWKEEIVDAVEAARPTLIIVTQGDELPTITYVKLDSEQYLSRSFPRLNTYITQNYKIAANFDHFVIYKAN